MTLNEVMMLMHFVNRKYNGYLYQAFEDEGAADDTDTGSEDETGTDDQGKTYTEDELNEMVDKIVNKRLARERAEAEKKTKAAAEAARLEKLTAEQKLQEKADALQKKITELEEKEARGEMAKTARKLLAAEDINLSDELLNVLITTDAETTKANVDSFVTLFNTHVQAKVKDAMKGKTPKIGTTQPQGTMTKEQIMAIQDPAKRRKAINDNIKLFKP